jgi:NADPH:quinone reductase-like Zn-dependent oxidoreductase
MKAISYTARGPPPEFQLVDIERPTPRDDEVQVKVHAASVNSWDWELLRKKPSRVSLGGRADRRHRILGADIAGRVETVGRDVDQFKPGDEVFGDISGSGFGGYAEYACVRERALVPKPASMSFVEAAATAQAGLLALQGLHNKERVRSGSRTLINGAGGGVGSFAIQIAKSYGAEVTGVDSTGKLDMMRSIGADHVIDYTKEDFTKNGQVYDRILDVQMNRSIFAYKRSLAPKGIYLTVGGSGAKILQLIFLGPLISLTGSRRLGLVLLRRKQEDLRTLGQLYTSGKVRPVIDRTYPLEETAEAFRYFDTRQVLGKLVITVGE